MADAKKDDKPSDHSNPSDTQDPNITERPEIVNLDPTKVVGTYAEQPDPNADRPAPLPNVPEGAKKAPAADEPGTGAIGDGSQ